MGRSFMEDMRKFCKKPDWEDILTFDDLVPEESRKKIRELKSRPSCQNLRKKIGDFYYCTHLHVPDLNLHDILRPWEYKIPSKENKICIASVSVAELALYCKNPSNVKNCPVRTNRLIRFGIHNKEIESHLISDGFSVVFSFGKYRR